MVRQLDQPIRHHLVFPVLRNSAIGVSDLDFGFLVVHMFSIALALTAASRAQGTGHAVGGGVRHATVAKGDADATLNPRHQNKTAAVHIG